MKVSEKYCPRRTLEAQGVLCNGFFAVRLGRPERETLLKAVVELPEGRPHEAVSVRRVFRSRESFPAEILGYCNTRPKRYQYWKGPSASWEAIVWTGRRWFLACATTIQYIQHLYPGAQMRALPAQGHYSFDRDLIRRYWLRWEVSGVAMAALADSVALDEHFWDIQNFVRSEVPKLEAEGKILPMTPREAKRAQGQ